MRRSVTTTVAGSVLVLCAMPAVIAMLMTPGPYWSKAMWLYLAGIAGAGVVMAWRPGLHRPAAAVAAVFAAHVAGRGTVAVRDLFNAQGAGMSGLGELAPSEMATLAALAAVVALVGTVAACVAVALLWREPRRGWGAWRPRRARLLVIGLAIVILSPLPGLLSGGAEMLTGAGEGLLYLGLPCGGGLAAAAWLGRRARRAATATVIVSTVAAALSLAATLVLRY